MPDAVFKFKCKTWLVVTILRTVHLRRNYGGIKSKTK